MKTQNPKTPKPHGSVLSASFRIVLLDNANTAICKSFIDVSPKVMNCNLPHSTRVLQSHIAGQLAVVNLFHASPGSAASLRGNCLFVDAKLVSFVIGPLGTFPGSLCVLLRRVLLRSI